MPRKPKTNWDIRENRPSRHGYSRTKEYRSWDGMIQRCYRPGYKLFHRYGGRGISVCQRWIDSVHNFMEDMGPCPDGFSLDRINNDGNYEPSNCKWSSAKDQSSNRVTCTYYEIDGVKNTLKWWCEHFGVQYKLVHSRIKYQRLSFIDAINRPIDKRQQHNSLCKKDKIKNV